MKTNTIARTSLLSFLLLHPHTRGNPFTRPLYCHSRYKYRLCHGSMRSGRETGIINTNVEDFKKRLLDQSKVMCETNKEKTPTEPSKLCCQKLFKCRTVNRNYATRHYKLFAFEIARKKNKSNAREERERVCCSDFWFIRVYHRLPRRDLHLDTLFNIVSIITIEMSECGRTYRMSRRQ